MKIDKKADMEFCEKLISEHPEIIETVLKYAQDHDKIQSWFRCPHCSKALFPVRADTRIEHMPYRCKACKHDIEVNVFPKKVNNLRAKSL